MVSYFELELLSDDTYAIKWYKGPTNDLTEIVIPKTFDGKKITVLGTDTLDLFIKNGKPQFELVMNENITEIKPSAFNTIGVTKVTGDTSSLSKIGAYALSWANRSGGNTLDITLTYPGKITVGDAIFNQTKVTLHLSHATAFSDDNFRAKSICFEFIDKHTYGEPEWIYSDDIYGATAVFTCTNPHCDYVVRLKANFDENGDNIVEPDEYCFVVFEGKRYSEDIPVYRTEVGDYIVEVTGRYRSIVGWPKNNVESVFYLTVTFMDKDGNKVDAPQYIWVAKENASDGIIFENNGNIKFTAIGEFHIQLKSPDGKTIYSPWIPVRSYSGGGDYFDEEPSSDVIVPDNSIPKTGDASSAGAAAAVLIVSLTSALLLTKKRRMV